MTPSAIKNLMREELTEEADWDEYKYACADSDGKLRKRTQKVSFEMDE